MRKIEFRFAWLLLALLMITMTACSVQTSTAAPTPISAAAANTPASQTFTDPFTYCAAVGTIDAPDVRYTGVAVPDAVINGFKKAAGLENSTEPLDMLQKSTIWRCMESKVYACNFGANLPCSSKANTDKTPSQAMEEYCKANPGSDSIPMSVTGHDTIYSWKCTKEVPVLLAQIETVDSAGYLQQIWYAIQPAVTGSTSPTLSTAASATPVARSGQIVFSSNRGGSYDDLYLLNINDSSLVRLTSGDSNTFAGPFSADGKQILFTGFGLTKSYVGVMNADGSGAKNLTNEADVDDAFPAWSPDGKLIVFTSRRDGNNEIYVMNIDGSQPTRLTNSPKDDFAPTWSPDSKQIAFLSDRENATGVYSIYVMKADGSAVKRLTNDKGNDYTPAWSPDGKHIAFRSVQKEQSDIYLVNTDGSGLTDLTNNPADDWSPAWSPDGTLIAFQTNRDGNWEIYTMNADGSDPQNITQNPADDQMPYWR
jgi:Tol biopolymer transport system component